MNRLLTILTTFILLLFGATGFSQNKIGSQETIVNIRQGTYVTLRANSTDAFSYQWLRNDLIIPNKVDPEFTTDQAGVYTVIAVNRVNCTSETSNKITLVVWPTAELFADISIQKHADNKPVNINDVFSYNITVKNQGPNDANHVIVIDTLPKSLTFQRFEFNPAANSSYNTQAGIAKWEIPILRNGEQQELKIEVKANTPGNVINTAHADADETDGDLSNNSSTDIKTIYGIKLPNVFTPNNDDINDTYRIAGLEAYPENEFTVLNRWGNHVYEKKSYNNEWTGDGLNDGTYYYVLKIKSPEKGWEVFRGFITLIRNKR